MKVFLKCTTNICLATKHYTLDVFYNFIYLIVCLHPFEMQLQEEEEPEEEDISEIVRFLFSPFVFYY